MNRRRPFNNLVVLALCALALHPAALRACSVCAGESDSAMSKGLVWGVAALLGVVLMVLGGITTFFVYIAKKSSTDKVDHDG